MQKETNPAVVLFNYLPSVGASVVLSDEILNGMIEAVVEGGSQPHIADKGALVLEFINFMIEDGVISAVAAEVKPGNYINIITRNY